LAVLEEYDGSGGVLRSYVPGVSVSIRSYVSGVCFVSGGVSYFYHYDRLGSVRFMSDESGNVVSEYVYDGWGNLVSSSGSVSQPYEYVGEQYYYTEPTINLQLLGARWYDSSVGRFISRDPIGEEGGVNLYVYVGNNSVNVMDPTGLDATKNIATECRIGTGEIIFGPQIIECCAALREYTIERYHVPFQLADSCFHTCTSWEGAKGGAIASQFANCLSPSLGKEGLISFLQNLLREILCR